MKKLSLILLTLFLLTAAQAQFNRTPTPNDTLKSVRMLPDNRVQLSLYAPKSAEVLVTGDFAGGYPNTKLSKQDNGVWSVTVGPLSPDVYSYNFIVDGVNTVDPKNPQIKTGQNNVSNTFELPGSEADFLALKNIPHGKVTSIYYYAASLGTMRRMHVYTPPGYETSTAKLPVLYLLHGGGDNDATWTDVGRADLILDNLYALGKSKSMLVVMPAGHTPSPGIHMGAGPDQDPFSKELLQDIIPYVEKNYRVSAKREHRALAGLSMGGIQTLNIALWHPDTFGYINPMSTGYFPPVIKELEEKYTAVLKNPAINQFKLFTIGMGKEDPLAYQNNKNMMALFDKMGIKYQYQETPGSHTYHVWRQNLYTLAPQLFR